VSGQPKLVISVVHADDGPRVAAALREAGHRFTRLASFGGFLGEPNQTFLVAVDEEAVDSVLEALAISTEARDVEVPLVLLERLEDWRARTVRHGGSTSLVLDLDRVVRS
jgi:uncharacterized protein YaaQ